MTRKSYRGRLNDLLEPLGFKKTGASDWIRIAGDMEECVNLQKSWIDGSVTVNLYSVDRKSQKLLREALPTGTYRPRWWVDQRIGYLFGDSDKWWSHDPNGPDEVAEKVELYGLPFLERFRDPLEQAKYFGLEAIGIGVPHLGAVLLLAITLERMGRHDDACRALDLPRRRTEIASGRADVEALRRYLGCTSDPA